MRVSRRWRYWIGVLLAVMTACEEDAERPARTAATARVSPAPEKAPPAQSPSPPPVLERLAAFAARAPQGDGSVGALDALIAEGEALVKEATTTGGDTVVGAEPLRDAMTHLIRLHEERDLLACASKPTAAEVAACVDQAARTAAGSTWETDVNLCQQAVDDGFDVALEIIAARPACRAAAPDHRAAWSRVRAQAAALATVDERAWTKQRSKALAATWAAFQKGDAAVRYWRAVADGIHRLCANVEDGELDVTAVVVIDGVVGVLGGEAALGRLPATSYKKMLKDTDAEKGKVLTVRAKVLQISKDGDYYRGQLIDDSFRSYMFVTGGGTDGIYEDSRVTLRGVVTQIEHFETRGGGTNAAPVVVGYVRK